MLRAVLSAGTTVAVPITMATMSTVHAAEDVAQSAGKPDTAADVKTDGSDTQKPEIKDPIHKQLLELREQQRDKRVHINQLPLYGEPVTAELAYIDEREAEIQKHVTVMRKAVWHQLDRFEGTWNVVKKNYRATKQYAKELAQYLREDAGALPRATFITVSGLGGIVAGYKGGPVRKLLYASAGMTGAAAVCYPQQAVDISKRGWILTKQQANDLYQQAKSGSTSAPAPDSKKETSEDTVATSDTEQASSKDTVTVAPKEKSETNEQPKKDFGMSNKEDKDMYSMRTS